MYLITNTSYKKVMKVANAFKIENEDFQVEYEILVTPDDGKKISAERKEINESIQEIDKIIDEYDEEIAKLDKEIDRLTNHADGLDYAIAVASGIFTGMVDSVFVDEFSIGNANKIGDEKAEKFVIKVAKKKGYKGDDLSGAISYLADKYKIAADKGTNKFGGGTQHHLRDFSHHPTIGGLFFSLLTQYTYKVYGTDTTGKFTFYELKEHEMSLIGKNIAEKITFGVINWFFHMVSDMCGESGTIRKGGTPTGLPGPIGALLKKISALPIFKKLNKKGYKEFSVWVSKLFNGTLLAVRDKDGKIIEKQKFDLRTEIGISNLIKQQAVPVIINECIVRGFYFIRHLYLELKIENIHSFNELKDINWEKILPFKNRTITRMLTIATGTFTAVDMADAVIRSGGINPKCLLRINFVGIGRFAIAVGTDVGMGIKRNKLVNKRIAIMGKELGYMNAKVFYKISGLQLDMQEMLESEENLWIEAENAEKALMESYEVAKCSVTRIKKEFEIIGQSIDEIASYREGIERHNPQLIREISDKLRY